MMSEILVRHPDEAHKRADNSCNWAALRDGKEHWDTFAVSSDISDVVSPEILLPFDDAPAELRENSSVAFPIKAENGSHSLVLYWIEGHYRWFALKQGTGKCGYCRNDREVYKEAALLDDYCRRKLYEGFDVPLDAVSIQKIDRVPPRSLKLMAKYQAGIIKIEFHRTYYEHYDSDETANIVVPTGGTLEAIPEELRRTYADPAEAEPAVKTRKYVEGPLIQGPFTPTDDSHVTAGVEFKMNGSYELMQLRWVNERPGWVALAYELRVSGDEHYESYAGPFRLDNHCFQMLLNAYGIPEGRLDPKKVPNLFPSTLEGVAQEGGTK